MQAERQSTLNKISPSDLSTKCSENPIEEKIERVYEAEGMENMKKTRFSKSPRWTHRHTCELMKTEAICLESALPCIRCDARTEG